MYTLKHPPTTPPSDAIPSYSSQMDTAIPVLATRSKALSPKHASTRVSPLILLFIRIRFSSLIGALILPAKRAAGSPAEPDGGLEVPLGS